MPFSWVFPFPPPPPSPQLFPHTQTAAVEMNTPPHHLTTEIKWDPKQNLEWKQDIYFPVTRVENQLKYVAQKKMLRVSEFFRDFDTLRSGYVTSKFCITYTVHFFVKTCWAHHYQRPSLILRPCSRSCTPKINEKGLVKVNI